MNFCFKRDPRVFPFAQRLSAEFSGDGDGDGDGRRRHVVCDETTARVGGEVEEEEQKAPRRRAVVGFLGLLPDLESPLDLASSDRLWTTAVHRWTSPSGPSLDRLLWISP
ncbi:uncharacterized protein LOC112463511 [Temnothorax curvispinosus]|uniref:Uncharacterized protein LOC112453095 n=1 Tax=Temnothorax curvispinosus TaxID=300111 RepID=A0A6J1PII5_9HYME|nr:uncharacterized protein LOC112453095 [Temnothorax curvispinosus]XP_024885706.1 uncharacterized protein LOC112463511 [Temnothorax curvispinosus]